MHNLTNCSPGPGLWDASYEEKVLVVAGGLGCGLAVVLMVVGVFLCKRREWWKVDTNEEVYGTYGRGEEEDGEYGDGDVMEVEDTNDYYYS